MSTLRLAHSPMLDSLLQAAQAEPDEDDTSRLVLADYLDEAGDPRGAMIRASLRLARLQPGDPGWYELSDELADWQERHQPAWLGKSRAVDISLTRGLLSVRLSRSQLSGTRLPRPVRSALVQGWVGDVHCSDIDEMVLGQALARGLLERVGSLNTVYCRIRPGEWPRLAPRLPQLRRLRVGLAYELTDADLASLAALPLQDLDLHSRRLSPSCLDHIRRLSQLRKLWLKGPATWSDDTLAQLSGLSELRSLAVGLESITEVGFGHLALLPRLERLTIWTNSRPTEENLGSSLRELPRLRHLQLSLLTDGCFERLTDLVVLVSLDCLGGGFTGSGLRHLAALASLRELRLEFCRQLTDEGLASLADLPDLEHLNLRQTPVSDAGLAPLARLTRLRSLDLSGCSRLTGPGLAVLKDLPDLRRLNLFDCTGLNKKDLPQLAQLTQLRELDVSCCMIRRTTIDRLQEALPRCRFTSR